MDVRREDRILRPSGAEGVYEVTDKPDLPYLPGQRTDRRGNKLDSEEEGLITEDELAMFSEDTYGRT
ncbi:hypothetical protein J7439_20985 [Salinisphaera sp. G21_0]|uniref:hypothetical protein n=1 Tax=Thalassotalea sp. G20_0 TaxID=2821093 RepID=UPI001ADBDB1E|nr:MULTISPECIES: hypothetical protein [Gammaproteobacteria]MBO9483876.1 hypothetical protein [Salinisphaera sp. G21_0]MBO9493123.1 hypothetical protein [Thalassotalea sp. G20_0]